MEIGNIVLLLVMVIGVIAVVVKEWERRLKRKTKNRQMEK